MIRTDGYYMSEGFQWTDWQAGHKFEGVKYYLIKFLNNKYLIRASNSSKTVSKNIFDNRMDYIDEYMVQNKDSLEIIVNPDSKWSVRRFFTILSPEILLDENLKEYRFIKTV